MNLPQNPILNYFLRKIDAFCGLVFILDEKRPENDANRCKHFLDDRSQVRTQNLSFFLTNIALFFEQSLDLSSKEASIPYLTNNFKAKKTCTNH